MKQVLCDLINCPHCDAVYRMAKPAHGQRAVCSRCKTVLIAPRARAGMQIIALAAATTILIISAALFPFLTIDASGAKNAVSLLDAALAFHGGPLVILSLASVALIVFIPLARVLLVLYVLVPIVFDRPAAPGAVRAFGLSEDLRPWSMAEVFALGCAVALIKISALAQVELGAAFWMFAILVVLIVVQDNMMCRWTIWNSLDPQRKS